jgi:hypothetical protein
MSTFTIAVWGTAGLFLAILLTQSYFDFYYCSETTPEWFKEKMSKERIKAAQREADEKLALAQIKRKTEIIEELEDSSRQ